MKSKKDASQQLLYCWGHPFCDRKCPSLLSRFYSRDGDLVTEVDLVVQEDVEKANFIVRTLRFLSQAFTDLGNWIVGLFA